MTDAFMHQHWTLVGTERFISGSICLSTPFERELTFCKNTNIVTGVLENFERKKKRRTKFLQPIQTRCRLAKLLASFEHECPSVRASMGHFAHTSPRSSDS